MCFGDLPADVVEIARQCLLDWAGVTVAGAFEPCAAILFDDLVDGGAAGGAGGASVVGRAERLPVADAALVNGTASHALDYDDVNEAMIGHPTVPIAAGLLALAEHRHANGRDVVTAFVAGYETQCRVGRAIGVSHYQRGFHATGTIGTFGAAAACARLLELDAAGTSVALALAAAQAAGLKSMFGTMTKPLHAGKASANGLTAARLAAGGFTAASAAIEAEQGFAETHTDSFDPARGLADPRQGWHIRDNLFKYHAACFQTHSSIEGLRRLRDSHCFGVEDVAEVIVDADAMQLRMCAIPEPVTGLEAKFSLSHTAAMVLAGVDTSGIESFGDDVVGRQEVLRARERVTVRTGRTQPGPTPVTVRLRDGSCLEAAHDVGVPESDLGLQRARLTRKLERLVGPVLGGERADAIAATLLTIDEQPDCATLLARLRRDLSA